MEAQEALFPEEISYPKIKEAPQPQVYVVLAYLLHGGYWKLFKETFDNIEKARDFVKTLPLAYGERRIYFLK